MRRARVLGGTITATTITATLSAIAVGAASLVGASVAGANDQPVLTSTAVEELVWDTCPDDLPRKARCSWLTVPRDWAEPETSGTYRIRVARIEARGPRIGVLSYNTGGPGGAALDALGNLYSALPRDVRQGFDIVAFDPRGVGYSQPRLAECEVDSPEPPRTGPVDAGEFAEAYARAWEPAMVDCLERNADHANNLGTWQVVRDLDALREALGEERISFWGMSYGTTVGRVYAQTFPTRVRALLLDGAINSTPSIGGYMREHIWSDISAVERMLGAFGPSAVKTYHRALRYLDKRTLRLAGGERLDRWAFIGALMNSAAYQQRWEDVAELLEFTRRALNRVQSRSGAVGERLMELVAELNKVDPIVVQETDTFDSLFQFVNCADMHDRPSVEQAAAAATQAMRVGGTAYLQPAINEGLTCIGLPPLGQSIKPLSSPLRLAKPPVVINSVADNRTVWVGARSMANAFAGSSMITYDGTQHVSYIGVSECITAPATEYLVNLTRIPRSIACPLSFDP